MILELLRASMLLVFGVVAIKLFIAAVQVYQTPDWEWKQLQQERRRRIAFYQIIREALRDTGGDHG